MSEIKVETNKVPIVVDCSELYRLRIVVMIETGLQTNKDQQVLMSPKQFKDFSDVLAKTFEHHCDDCGKENCNSLLIDEDRECKLPEEIKSIYHATPTINI